MSITKANIVHSLYIHCRFSKTEAVERMDSFSEVMKKSLETGEDVLISGF